MDSNGMAVQPSSLPIHFTFNSLIYTNFLYKRLDTERVWSFVWMLSLLFHLLRTFPRWISINYCKFTLLFNEGNCFNELIYFGEKDSVYTTLDFRLHVKWDWRKIWLVSDFIYGDVCWVFNWLRLSFDWHLFWENTLDYLREGGVEWTTFVRLDLNGRNISIYGMEEVRIINHIRRNSARFRLTYLGMIGL